MIAALDLIPRVASRGVITIMHRARDGETFERETFPNHVAGDLILEAGHALVEIHGGPRPVAFAFGPVIVPVAARKRTHQQTGFARQRIPAARFVHGAIRPDIRRKVVTPQRFQRGHRFLLRQHARQADLKRPALPEHLVNLAARAGIDRVRMFRVNLVDEILAVEKLRDPIFLTGFKYAPALPREFCVANLIGHVRRRRQRREIQTAQPRHRPEPVGVERVVLLAFNDPVSVAVLADEPLGGEFNFRPVAFEEFPVRRHLMFAERAQNRSGLSVHGGVVVELAAKINCAVRLLRQTEIYLLARAAFQFGKQPRRRVRVVINVAARSLATAHAFPAIVTSVRKPIRC